jgi:hypothetical protein
MTEEIDMTPQGLKTFEGRARVDAANKAFEKSRTNLEMSMVMFCKEHLETVRYALRELPDGEGEAALADLEADIDPALKTREDAAREFLLAVAGIDNL